jgi:hypothetical protein
LIVAHELARNGIAKVIPLWRIPHWITIGLD